MIRRWDGHSSTMELAERRGEYDPAPRPAPDERFEPGRNGEQRDRAAEWDVAVGPEERARLDAEDAAHAAKVAAAMAQQHQHAVAWRGWEERAYARRAAREASK